MKMCSKCNTLKDESEFFVKDKGTGRLHAQYKLCYREHRKTYYQEHYQKYHEEYLNRAKKRREMMRLEYRNNLLSYIKDKKCVFCGEDDIRTLEFDHINPGEKKFSISKAVALGYRWKDVELEIAKCQILCANCHKKRTAEQYGWYKLQTE